MARVTVAQLQDEVAELRATVDHLAEVVRALNPGPSVSLNIDAGELRRPISEPLDAHALHDEVAARHSYYDESEGWSATRRRSGHGVYL